MKFKNISIQLLFFSLLNVFLFGCGSKIKLDESPFKESTAEVIKPKAEYTPYDLSELIDTFKFVKLEMTENSIIGNVDKLIVFEDRIYILDKLTLSLFIFDLDGNYQFKISRVGHGPGEYTQLDFFDIDFENRQIVLTDLLGYWVMRFKLNGDFISREKIPFWIEGIAPIFDKQTIIYSNYRNNKHMFDKEYNIYYLDSLMQVLKAYFPYNSSIFSNPVVKLRTPQAGPFYTYDKNRYFFSSYRAKTYKIDKEGLSLEFEFDFGDKSFNIEYLNQKNNLKNYIDKGDFFQLGNVLENDDFVIFSFYQTSFPIGYFGYYSKDSHKVICSTNLTVGKNSPFDGNNVATYDSWIISTIRPEQLLSWAKAIDRKEISPKNEYVKLRKSIADKITLNDNQILMFYKLKQF